MDTDWASNASDRKTTSTFIFSLGSETASRSSKKQPMVALSSTKDKYRGTPIVAYQALWLKRLLKNLNELVDE